MGGSWGVIPPPQAPSPCHSVWCVTTSQPHSVPTSEAGYPAAVCKVCVCVCVCVCFVVLVCHIALKVWVKLLPVACQECVVLLSIQMNGSSVCHDRFAAVQWVDVFVGAFVFVMCVSLVTPGMHPHV